MDSSFQSDTAQEQAKFTTFFDQNLSAINRCVLDSVPDAEPSLPLKKENFNRNLSSLNRCVLDSSDHPQKVSDFESTPEEWPKATYDRNLSSLDRCVLDTAQNQFHDTSTNSKNESQKKPMKLYVTDPLDSSHAFPPLDSAGETQKKKKKHKLSLLRFRGFFRASAIQSGGRSRSFHFSVFPI